MQRYRNSDAQRFLDLIEYRKSQEREIEQMNASFFEFDELDFEMDYAMANDD